ncbi:fasciclin domain-containing protein [Geodermatophilus sp. SYSU D00815]
MKSTTLARGVPAGVALVLTLAACSSDGSSGTGAAASSTPATSSAPAADDGATSSEPFGAACAEIPAAGGGFEFMSTAPVVTAAGSTPVFSTLVRAVTAAGLVESLNAQEDVTVLAPAEVAFQAVPADQLGAVLADVPQLTAILTHHVVQGRLAPDELAGEHTTLNNDTVTIEGSGEQFTISGEQTLTTQPASVICGNVRTANATVYVIDQVLAPEPAG